jgi:hypothetical protein
MALKTRPARRGIAAVPPPAFRRYTNLAAAIHLLQSRKITLLNPARWDDANDAYFMAEYKRLVGAETVLALCFAETAETYHHWRVFSHGADGVCIEFDKARLLASFDGQPCVQQGKVTYLKIATLQKRRKIDAGALPFLKRKPYQPEREYRVIYVDRAASMEAKDFDIELSWIRRITLSPWMSDALKESVKKTLRGINDDCRRLSISRSTLVGNDVWKGLTAKAVLVT